MELEGVLEDGETAQQGIREANELMDRLGIGADRLVLRGVRRSSERPVRLTLA
jgi:hypothetical protein